MKTKQVSLSIGDELHAAATVYGKANGLKFSGLVQKLIREHLIKVGLWSEAGSLVAKAQDASKERLRPEPKPRGSNGGVVVIPLKP